MGFSNTALNTGYTAPLRRRLAQSHPALEVRVCGLGGLGPQILPVMFDRLHRLHGPFTHVLLEIATSAYATATMDDPAQAADLIADCLNRVAETGARPALLHLLRTDLAGARLPFTALLTQAAEAQGYPVVDLAEGLVAREGRDFALGLLRGPARTPARPASRRPRPGAAGSCCRAGRSRPSAAPLAPAARRPAAAARSPSPGHWTAAPRHPPSRRPRSAPAARWLAWANARSPRVRAAAGRRGPAAGRRGGAAWPRSARSSRRCPERSRSRPRPRRPSNRPGGWPGRHRAGRIKMRGRIVWAG